MDHTVITVVLVQLHNLLSTLKPYRRWRGGAWRYVRNKYIPGNPGCWIHDENATWWEFVEQEEHYPVLPRARALKRTT